MSLPSYLLSQVPGRVTRSFSEVPRYTWRDSALRQSSGGGFLKCHRVIEGFQSSVTELCSVYRHPSLRPVRPAARHRGQPQGLWELLSLTWLGGDLGPSLQHPTSTGRAQLTQHPTAAGPRAGLPEGALPAQPAAWPHLEQTWPLTLHVHDCRQAEVACPQAFRSLLLMKHSPVRKSSLPATQKATRLRGDGGSVPGHSPAVGEVQQEENRSHNQSQDETGTWPFCWPWTSFTSPNSSGTL